MKRTEQQADADARLAHIRAKQQTRERFNGYQEARQLDGDDVLAQPTWADVGWLLARLEAAEQRIDTLIDCASFQCPYERRMVEAEAAVLTLQPLLKAARAMICEEWCDTEHGDTCREIEAAIRR